VGLLVIRKDYDLADTYFAGHHPDPGGCFRTESLQFTRQLRRRTPTRPTRDSPFPWGRPYLRLRREHEITRPRSPPAV